jgi:hypothetical protein
MEIMAKSKKKVVTIKAKKISKDPRIEEIYEQEVTFECPVRGKVTQKVKIKRYRATASNEGVKHVLKSSDSIDSLEEHDDGLSIYSDGEDLGIKKEDEDAE